MSAKERLVILMYHAVDVPRTDVDARFCTPPVEFARQMAYLAHRGYTALSLTELCAVMRGESQPPSRGFHVTFDDGFDCVLAHAAPVLRHYGFPATMFAVSDRLGQFNDWMTPRGFSRRSLLAASGLHALEKAGFTIGSHTRTHARLNEIPNDRITDEILGSKHRLEDELGKPVAHFAYPFGLLNESVHAAVIEAGYESACSTRAGFNRAGQDPYLLRRIDVFGTDALWQFRQKIKFGVNEASRTLPFRYLARRLSSRFHR